MNGRTFELKRELGDGAFGTVYLADLVSTGGFRKAVALKLLKPDWDTASDAARRLRDEARLLGRLRHRHIVQVDDLIRLDGRWAVVMEYVEGVDLERLIHEFGRFPIPPAAAAEMVSAVAQALDAAWNGAGLDGQPLRVVHRDIKPSNIRLSAQGEVKVLDFGIARADFSGREARTERVRYGSMGYMSPERLLGDPEVPAGDVFAIGAVFYELLTGEPFGRVKLGPDAAQAMLDERLAHAARILPPALQPALDLVRSCLAYEVEDRPETGALVLSLRALARSLPGDDLYAWTRQTLPSLLAEGHSEAQLPQLGKMLTEQIDSQTFKLADEVRPDSTLAVESSPRPNAPTLAMDLPTEPTARRRSLAVPIAALVALLVLVIPGVIAFNALYDDPSPSPTAMAPPSEAAAPAPPAPTIEPDPLPPQPAKPQEDPTEAVAAATADDAPPKDIQPQATTSPPPVPQPATAAAEAAPEVPTSTATVDRVKFHVPGAQRVEARCGGVKRSSTSASVNLTQIPSGSCTVLATVDGVEHSARVQVHSPNGFTCQPGGGGLSCTSQL